MDRFAAVRLEVVVRLPIELPDDDWVPYAQQLRRELEGAVEAVRADRLERAADAEEEVRFVNEETWEVR